MKLTLFVSRTLAKKAMPFEVTIKKFALLKKLALLIDNALGMSDFCCHCLTNIPYCIMRIDNFI